jgi:hypothetical protein
MRQAAILCCSLAVIVVTGFIMQPGVPVGPPPPPPPEPSAAGGKDGSRDKEEVAQQIEVIVPVRWDEMPPISAVVTAVNDEHNVFVLSVGREDAVRVGFQFIVFREDEYVGKLIIFRVERGWCAGRSKRHVERVPIRKGDRATTRF